MRQPGKHTLQFLKASTFSANLPLLLLLLRLLYVAVTGFRTAAYAGAGTGDASFADAAFTASSLAV